MEAMKGDSGTEKRGRGAERRSGKAVWFGASGESLRFPPIDDKRFSTSKPKKLNDNNKKPQQPL
jgi:hypothetical protein